MSLDQNAPGVDPSHIWLYNTCAGSYILELNVKQRGGQSAVSLCVCALLCLPLTTWTTGDEGEETTSYLTEITTANMTLLSCHLRGYNRTRDGGGGREREKKGERESSFERYFGCE